mmetsp:Transcript_31271/g.64529  ORF Transcript_31271/g.64529 Transcript_31271/m.64529 type:complete len:129 (+) Transcript_31271:45-431(+)
MTRAPLALRALLFGLSLQVWRLCFATELGILSARARVAWLAAGLTLRTELPRQTTVHPVASSKGLQHRSFSETDLSTQDMEKVANLVLSGGALYASGAYNSSYAAVLEAQSRAMKRSTEYRKPRRRSP